MKSLGIELQLLAVRRKLLTQVHTIQTRTWHSSLASCRSLYKSKNTEVHRSWTFEIRGFDRLATASAQPLGCGNERHSLWNREHYHHHSQSSQQPLKVELLTAYKTCCIDVEVVKPNLCCEWRNDCNVQVGSSQVIQSIYIGREEPKIKQVAHFSASTLLASQRMPWIFYLSKTIRQEFRRGLIIRNCRALQQPNMVSFEVFLTILNYGNQASSIFSTIIYIVIESGAH